MRSVIVLVAALASVAGGQSLETRMASANGSVAFHYQVRPNVCGNGHGIEVSDDSSSGWMYRSSRRGVHYGMRSGNRNDRCEQGPAHVLLRRDGARVTDLVLAVGGSPERGNTDLGEVPASEASRYLLALAPHLAGKAGDHAVLGAVIAEGGAEWRKLMQIARNQSASESSRKSAVFWVSQEASVAATRGLDSIATDDDVNLPVRKDALFYLAQRPQGEGIPALVKVAESSRSLALRKDAIWFLAQSRDERALALFEKLLAGR